MITLILSLVAVRASSYYLHLLGVVFNEHNTFPHNWIRPWVMLCMGVGNRGSTGFNEAPRMHKSGLSTTNLVSNHPSLTLPREPQEGRKSNCCQELVIRYIVLWTESSQCSQIHFSFWPNLQCDYTWFHLFSLRGSLLVLESPELSRAMTGRPPGL